MVKFYFAIIKIIFVDVRPQNSATPAHTRPDGDLLQKGGGSLPCPHQKKTPLLSKKPDNREVSLGVCIHGIRIFDIRPPEISDI